MNSQMPANTAGMVLELMFYYLCTLLLYTKVFRFKYRTERIFLSLACFLPVWIVYNFHDADVTFLTVLGYILFMPLLDRWTIKKSSLLIIIQIHLFLHFFNILICMCIDSLLGMDSSVNFAYELAVNTFTAAGITIICMTKMRNKLRTIMVHTPKNIKLLLLCLLIVCSNLSVLVIKEPMFPHNLTKYNTTKIIFLIMIILFTLTAVFIIMYSMTNRIIKNKAENYKKFITAQHDCYRQLSDSYLEIRRFRHDYKNMQIGLKKLLSDNRTKEALEMLDTINKQLDDGIRFHTGNSIVDALLNDKLKTAAKINTVITFEGNIPANAVENVDMCIIFGNALDNAIEACEKIGLPSEIHITSKCGVGFVLIEISNPVSESVDINGFLPETTKANPDIHGFGLYSIQQVIKKYDGKIKCECDGSVFKLSVELFLYQ